jgi:hypothetical protein
MDCARSHPYTSRYYKLVNRVNRELGETYPDYYSSIVRRRNRSRKADEVEEKQLVKFTSNPKPIDYIVFIACHGITVDDFSITEKKRSLASFPFETVIGSHLGMPVFRYSNDDLYEWMCNKKTIYRKRNI